MEVQIIFFDRWSVLLSIFVLLLPNAALSHSSRNGPVLSSPLRMPLTETEPVPPLLSATGAFLETRSLTPAPNLIPYDLNVPFWSDGAEKRRWIALPDENKVLAKIQFTPTGEWTFPS